MRTVAGRVQPFCPFYHRTRPPEAPLLSIEWPSSPTAYTLCCFAVTMKKVRIRRTKMRRAMVRRVVMRREASAESQQHNLMWEFPTIALHTSSPNSADPVGSNVMEEVRGAPNEGAASKHLCQAMKPLVEATNDSHEPLSSARPGIPIPGMSAE